MTHHTHPDSLERKSFIWSEVRLIIAALALLLGGVPPIILVTPPSVLPTVLLLLKISWIISGATAAYLLYRWYAGGMRVLGGNETKDSIAFLVLGVSGVNLGLVGLLGNNIGMSLASGRLVFTLVAIAYVWAAWHLYTRWKGRGERLF